MAKARYEAMAALARAHKEEFTRLYLAEVAHVEVELARLVPTPRKVERRDRYIGLRTDDGMTMEQAACMLGITSAATLARYEKTLEELDQSAERSRPSPREV